MIHLYANPFGDVVEVSLAVSVAKLTKPRLKHWHYWTTASARPPRESTMWVPCNYVYIP